MNNNRTILLEYLKKRGAYEPAFEKLFSTEVLNSHTFSTFTVSGFDYAVDHFLDESDQPGYGLVRTNAILNLDDSNQLAIALVEGDDVICMNTDDHSINIWLVESGRGERMPVADSLNAFLQKCMS